MWNKNSGYYGNRMSVRAYQAYEDGEKPISKWTKEDIVDGINSVKKIPGIEKLTKQELINSFLHSSSYHHTGSYCNETDFYKINEDKVESFSASHIDSIVSSRTKKERVPKPANNFITAFVQYYHWYGTRKHPKKEVVEEVVNYRSNDKLVSTRNGNKRLSSLSIFKKIEQKTRFAPDKKVK